MGAPHVVLGKINLTHIARTTQLLPKLPEECISGSCCDPSIACAGFCGGVRCGVDCAPADCAPACGPKEACGPDGVCACDPSACSGKTVTNGQPDPPSFCDGDGKCTECSCDDKCAGLNECNQSCTSACSNEASDGQDISKQLRICDSITQSCRDCTDDSDCIANNVDFNDDVGQYCGNGVCRKCDDGTCSCPACEVSEPLLSREMN